MRRGRGRGKSTIGSSVDPRAYTTSPEAAPRKSKRSSSTARSRLYPSEPLHMTTRRAASKAASNSTTASIASGDSRRSSLADTTLVGGVDIDLNRPTKRARLSDPSNSTSGSRRSAVRQRKTLSQDQIESLEFSTSKEQVTPEPPRILEPSRSSSENGSKRTIANGNRESFNANAQRKLLSPFPKRRGRRQKTSLAASPARSTNGTPAPGTPLNSQQDAGTDRDVSRVAKRMPGRRRAPHADASIEADLRRQLQLRLAYRSVAKALKPLLAELAQRSIDDIENDEEAHKESDEYEKVQAELDAYLARRLRAVNKETEERAAYSVAQMQIQKEMFDERFVGDFQKLQHDYAIRGQNRFLEICRTNAQDLDLDATDDEDGIVVSLHGKPTSRNPTGYLDKRYDSRSRFYIETERHGWRHETKLQVRQEQQDAANGDDSDVEPKLPEPGVLPGSFATIDMDRREHACNAFNLSTLARATKAVEEEANRPKPAPVPMIPNSAAHGLQALAAASEYQPKSQPLYAPPASTNYSYGPMPPPPQAIINPGQRISIDLTLSPPTKAFESKDEDPHLSSTYHPSPYKSHKRNHSRNSSGSAAMSMSTFSPMSRVDEHPGDFSPVLNGQRYDATRIQQPQVSNTDVPNRHQDHPLRQPSLRERSKTPPATNPSLWTSVYGRMSEGANRRESDPEVRHARNDGGTGDDNIQSVVESNQSSGKPWPDQNPQHSNQHRRNPSIPGRLLTPPSYLAGRSQSPGQTGRRATVDHPGPLMTNFAPPPISSAASGSQSAIEPLQRRQSPHPMPGSWQSGQSRTSPNAQPFNGRYPPLAPTPHYPGQPYPPQAYAVPHPGPPPHYQGPPQYAPQQQQYQTQNSPYGPPPGAYPPVPPPQSYSGQQYQPSIPYSGPPPPPSYVVPHQYSNQPPYSQSQMYSAPGPYSTTAPPAPYPAAAFAPQATIAASSPYSSAAPISYATTAPAHSASVPPYATTAALPTTPQGYTYGPPSPPSEYAQGPPPPPSQDAYQPGHARHQSSGSWSR